MGSLWKMAIEANVTPFILLQDLRLRGVSTNTVGVQRALRALVLSGIALGCTGDQRMEEPGAGSKTVLSIRPGITLDFPG